MENDELKNIAPNLSKIKKEGNFSVPDGYFENFKQRLDEKIHQEEKVPFFEKIVQLVRPQLALATLMVSVAIIGYFGYKIFIPENQNSTIDQNIIAQILDDEIYYMDEAFIVETFSEKEEPVQESKEVSEELVKEIIDYLSEDGMSLDLILEDL